MEFESSPPVSDQACPVTVCTTTVNAFSVSTVLLTSSAALVSTASMSTTSATTVNVSSVPTYYDVSCVYCFGFGFKVNFTC